MRTFLSINLPEPVKQELQIVQSKLQRSTKFIRWTNPEGMHITLKFIGEYPETELDRINTALQPLAKSSQSFDLELGEFGTFPSRGKPSILWVGVTFGENDLTTLANQITTILKTHDIPADHKPFVPHITVGRAKRGKPVFVADDIHIPLKDTRFHVQSFYLMESRLTPEGAVYSERIQFPLKG